MSFVHGHAREATWVVSHLRAPNRAEEGQLELPAAGRDAAPEVIPEPREPADELSPVRRSAR